MHNLINPKEINFLKIDIDSNDHEVLYGADNLLDNDNFFGLQIEVDFAKAKGVNYRNYIEVLRYMNSKNFNLLKRALSEEFDPNLYGFYQRTFIIPFENNNETSYKRSS